MESSGLRDVVLSRVDHRASGNIRCEVVAENTFETDSKSVNLTVVGKSFFALTLTII